MERSYVYLLLFGVVFTVLCIVSELGVIKNLLRICADC